MQPLTHRAPPRRSLRSGLLRPGDHVIAPIESYHGTANQLREIIGPMGVAHTFVDMTKLDAVRAALTPRTRLVWIETPSNPMLNLTDIAAVAELSHAQGALVCCDNTFATPIWQKPFELGADLVMHSSTKYFGGHSDVMGGALIVRDPGELAQRLRSYQETAGAVPSPFDCWLIRRSLTTLSCRVRAQSESAHRIAEFLAGHSRVERVFYPGLDSHPGHQIALRRCAAASAQCFRSAYAAAARRRSQSPRGRASSFAPRASAASNL